jgi:hypothetical protein
MKNFLHDLLRGVLRLLKPRRGKLIVTRHASGKMYEHYLDNETVQDVYRYGEEIKKNMIVHKYRNYTAGIIIEPDEANNNCIVVATCWKRDNW